MGMRLLLGFVLSSVLLAPTVAALDLVEVPPWDEAVHGLGRLVVPLGQPPSLNDAVERSLRPAPVVDPVSGWTAPPAQAASAGPAPPAQAAASAGVDLLLWALAFGGAATAVGLGWRHLHARNALEHPTRLAMLALLRAQPGLHLRALARASGLAVQRAAYHLDAMERLGLVASQDIGGKRCYFEAGAGPEVRRALADAALQPGATARDVMAFIAAHPGASQSEVARSLGLLPGSARWHLRRLTEHGSLSEAREGKALTYRPRGPSSGPRP